MAIQKPEITGKHSEKRKKTTSTETKGIVGLNTKKYKLGRGPVFTLAWQGRSSHPCHRQLCQWSGAFQTQTATSSSDGVTRNNQYGSTNAGRSQRALSISTQ